MLIATIQVWIIGYRLSIFKHLFGGYNPYLLVRQLRILLNVSWSLNKPQIVPGNSPGTFCLADKAGAAVIAVVTEDLVKRGLKSGDLLTGIGGKGGGRPNLAQGSLPEGSIREALGKLSKVVEEKVK